MRTILAGLLLCTAFAVGDAHAQLKLSQRRTDAEDIARGKALTEAGDCASCHTADPAKPFAGGKRIDTPFGGIYSPNLTPDRDTGLGAWSDDDFYRALRFGVAPDGSRYYPAFPYPNFTKLTRQDILAIRAYLATLTPVRNTPPRARTALAAELSRRDARLELAVLQARHHRCRTSKRARNGISGRYLVEGAGHCGACHTPKNMFGADRRGAGLRRQPRAGHVRAAARCAPSAAA